MDTFLGPSLLWQSWGRHAATVLRLACQCDFVRTRAADSVPTGGYKCVGRADRVLLSSSGECSVSLGVFLATSSSCDSLAMRHPAQHIFYFSRLDSLLGPNMLQTMPSNWFAL